MGEGVLPMKGLGTSLLGLAVTTAVAETELFEDPFDKTLAEGWSILRENPDAWRVREDALEIRVEPGNMWGGANDAKNVFYREAPAVENGAVRVSCTVENTPSHLYEQVNLVWYYDDGHMVKIGLELVHEQLSLVMGREADDRARTIAIIPMETNKIDVRFTVHGTDIHGQWRASGAERWNEAGKCDVPANGAPKLSIQAYQGDPDVEHWARISNFTVVHVGSEPGKSVTP